MVERGDVQSVLPRKLNCFSETVLSVPVVAENEGAVNPDIVAAQVCERLLKPARHRVEGLVHVLEIGRVQTLETD